MSVVPVKRPRKKARSLETVKAGETLVVWHRGTARIVTAVEVTDTEIVDDAGLRWQKTTGRCGKVDPDGSTPSRIAGWDKTADMYFRTKDARHNAVELANLLNASVRDNPEVCLRHKDAISDLLNDLRGDS